MADEIFDPLKQAYEGKKLSDLVTKEQGDFLTKALGLGVDYGAAFPQGIMHALGIKEFYEPFNPFTKEGRAEGIANLAQGIEKLSKGQSAFSKFFPDDGYYSPGQALTDYESLPEAKRQVAERMTLYTDPLNLFLLGAPGLVRKKATTEVGDELLAGAMKEGLNRMQPGLVFSGGVAGGKATTNLSSVEDFWNKVSDPKTGLDIYKGMKFEDLGRVDKGNFMKKYDRFISKGISVDDIVITRDRKRLIYPETYNTKSPYPYKITEEPSSATGQRFTSGVDFSHIENGQAVEVKFAEMVEELYKYPMNSKNIPENLKPNVFNKEFFDGEKSDDYVNSIISAYARSKNIQRPVLGADVTSATKAAITRADIKKNGNYAFENKIRGADDVNLHHSATKKKPYTAEDLMYIDSFVNQKTLETFEASRNKLLNKQKKAIDNYLKNPNAENKKVLTDLNEELLDIIGNENTYGLLSAPLANFSRGSLFLSEFKFTSPGLKILDSTGIFKGRNIKDLNLIEQVILDFNRPLKKVKVNKQGQTTRELSKQGELISNREFVEKFDNTIEGPLDASIDYLINRKTIKNDPFFRSQQKSFLQQNPDKNSDDALEAIKEYIKNEAVNQMIEFGVIQSFKEGGRVGFVTGGLSESIKEVQEEIKRATQPLRETISDVTEPYAIKTREVLDDTAKVLNKNERPAQFRVVSDGYKLVTQSPILKSLVALPAKGQIAGLEAIEAIYNTIRPGVENDIEMQEKFPAIYGIHRLLTQSVGKTPDNQTYISVVDEINRAQETGFTRLGYNIADLVASGIDGISNRTEFTERVRESYDKSVKEGRFTEPETFLGEVGAIAVEFGAPGGAIFKGVNAARRFLGGITGFNLFTTPTYSLKGGKWLATKISNVAKRAGTSATVFGATDIVAGGPYNTVSDAFSDDPLMFDESLGYDYEDTTGLSGKELAIANFKNRLRFGADGAIIGGLFPLVGPPLWAATKFGVIKPVTGLTKGLLRVGDELAVKPVSYLATGTLKAPLSKPGQLEVQVPLLGEAVQGIGSGVKIFADFLGKDVITRAAVAAMGAKPGLIKQLPDFKDWRLFDISSDNPLERNLKKIDNVFSFFREAGPRSANQLFLDTEAQNFIKGKQRQIEKLIDSIERKAYDLANGFLRKYNTAGTSPAGQEYLLDQTLAYLKGQIKLSQLEPELRETAKALNDEFVQIRTLFRDVLPEGSGLRDFLTTNLRSYIRQSFAAFTNPQFKPDPELVEKAAQFIKGRIEKNESLVELAIKGTTKPTDDAILDFAKKQVRDLLATAKSEGFDPLIQLQKIARENLKMDDLIIQTGEELPTVIRKLLGEEDSLRSSVLQTTSSLLTQATNLKNYERIGELLLKEGRLFRSRDEAIAAGITNPLVVGRVPGLGLLESGIANLYGSREVTDLLRGTGGMLDKFMQNSIYQSMIAYKAGVQTGKTVLSPATQSRNFLSAGAFVLNNGWIGGKASVTDAFKIVLDDVFGAGRTLNEVDLINNIARKSELGVIDENIVASELTAVLSDIKNGKIGTIAQLTTRADDSALMKTATRLYSGGDNVWKWYAHEYLMSQLKGAFKNVDEVKRAVLDDFGIDVFNPKNLAEAVEEYSALLVRELMPTYSKVPPVIQAIRKIPFFGNFVSFPAEILRTSVATSSLAMKHIASGNPTLRAMGLRSLAGQGLTLFALNEGAKALGHAFTNVTPEQIKTYKEEFGPAFMRFSELVPISNIDEKKGTFKVFDLSRFNPYDLVTSTTNNLLVRATDPQATLDPSKIETDVFKSYLDASGPLLDLVNGTLLGFSIGFEGIAEIFEGRTKQGSPIYSDSDRDIDKLDKAIAHLLKKDEPGILSTGRRILDAIAQDVTGTGQLIKLEDEAFKLAGGSSVTVDVPGSFAYKISEFKNTFKDAKVSEGFYSTKNYQQRGPAQLVREYNQQNEEAFREQYRFYRATRAALDSGLMNRSQVIKALQARDLSGETIQSILSGRFVPLSYGKDALIGRYNKIKAGQPDKRFSISDFVPVGALEKVKNKWRKFKFEDFERERKEPIDQTSALPKLGVEPEEEKIVTPQLPQSPDPAPPLAQAADVIPATGLTTTETALLSPSDQVIRQRQRGIV